jgi:hypothetical protein
MPGSYKPSGFPRGYEFTDNIWINWEPDTHLSYESIMAFYSGVAAGGNNYVHVSAMSVTLGDAAYYVRSTNGGLDWENGYPLYDGNGPSAVDIQVLADSNYAYVIFTNGSNNYVMYSSDYGENWSAWNDVIIYSGGIFEAVRIDSIMYLVRYTIDYHYTSCVYSNDHGLRWRTTRKCTISGTFLMNRFGETARYCRNLMARVRSVPRLWDGGILA